MNQGLQLPQLLLCIILKHDPYRQPRQLQPLIILKHIYDNSAHDASPP